MRALALQVLSRLSHEQFTSGAALAKELGVSRSAISDALKEAEAHHIEVFSLTRRGYRLASPLELLDVDRVRIALGAAAHRVDVDVVATIASTNTEMLERAQQGAASGACLAAEIQTAGRGRRGRSWHSAFAASLTFSLLWRFDKGAAQLGGLSLVVGLALVRALRAAGVGDAMLKWPNDVVVRNRKLAGILIETTGDMLGPTAAVIGIGVNVRLPGAALKAISREIDQPVTDVMAHAAHTSQISRNTLLANLLRELVPALDQFNVAGFADLREEWLRCHALHEQPITVLQGEATFDAVVKDVALDGSLIVLLESGAQGKPGAPPSPPLSPLMSLNSAEISVRAVHATPAARSKVA
jgi:BirA family biotin operon repressor/biotin-[acetyl-CoA-carboxylase] ligase